MKYNHSVTILHLVLSGLLQIS